MPRAHASLLGAYRRYGGYEDPLTELLATTLEACPHFARQLFQHIQSTFETDLRIPETVLASTQVRTSDGRRVDLEILGLDKSGSICSRLWSENKCDAAYQPDQLRDYQRSLLALSGQGMLITIVSRREQAEPMAASLDVPVLTWSDVALIAWAAGCEATEDARWRSSADSPGTSGSIRALSELISYLEEEVGVSLEPLTYEHINAFGLANETAELLEDLLDRTATHADSLEPDGKVGSETKKDLGIYWQVFNDLPNWVNDPHAYRELTISDTDEWTRDRLDQPAVGAGVVLPDASYEELRSADLASWRQDLTNDGFPSAY